MDERPRPLIPISPHQLATPPPDRRSLLAILWQVVSSAEAARVPRPVVPSDLGEMPALRRVYECLRFYLLEVEYALSPGGQLRGLGRWACRISVAVGIVALTLAMVLACATMVLSTLLIMTGQLVTILWNLLLAVLLFIALLIVGTVLLVGVRSATQQRRSSASRGGYAASHGRSRPG